MSSLIDNVTQGAKSLVDKTSGDVREFIESGEAKKLLPYLVTGGVGATAGAVMTGRRRAKRESRLGYLGRILRNAALTGGLAAGGHALLDKGISSTLGGMTGVGKDGKPLPPEDTPLESTLRRVAFSPLTAATSGAAALAATHRKGVWGLGDPGKNIKAFRDMTGTGRSADVLHGLPAAQIQDIVDGAVRDNAFRQLTGSDFSQDAADKLSDVKKLKLKRLTSEQSDIINRFRRLGGLPAGDRSAHGMIRGASSTLLRRYLSTFGQSHGRRAYRGGLGLVAAGLPAVIGAALTRKEHPE